VIESHPAGYRLAVRPGAVDALDFQVLAARGRRALAEGDPREAAAVLRSALASWRGQPLADAAGYDFADAAAAQLTELRSSVLADRIEADLALGEGASLVGELRALLSADPLAERPRALLMRTLYAAGRQAEALEVYHQARELLAGRLGVDPSAQLEQVYLRILRGQEGVPAVATGAARPSDQTLDAARSDRDGSRRRQSRWRELPNMISSQDGTEDRRPRAALRFWRPVCSAPASACAAASPFAAGGSAAVSTADGGAA
jgi:DNA-binding SARP family transcriptional activator